MLLLHPDRTCTVVSIQAQEFAQDDSGSFDIPPALVPEAQRLLKMAPAPAKAAPVKAQEPDPSESPAAEEAKADGDEFDRMGRFDLFNYAKANGIGGFTPSSKNDDMRAAFRARLVVGQGPET